jgi:Cu-Zn family superoxide dismutase
MKKIGLSFVCVVLAACGGSSKSSTQPQPVAAASEPAPMATPEAEPEQAVYAAPGPGGSKKPPTDDSMGDEPAQPEPPAQPAPTMLKAKAELKAVKDDASMGTVTFEAGPEGQISIVGDFSGLKKNGVHAFYVHENGDCSNKGKKVGKHLDPTKQKHGPPSSSTRHAGDFGNLNADESGNATFEMMTDSITLESDRADSVLGRAIVVYAKKDNKKGNPGAPLACGVIELTE